MAVSGCQSHVEGTEHECWGALMEYLSLYLH